MRMDRNDASEAICAAAADPQRDAVATAGQLFPVLYRELHRLAQRQLRNNAPGATLSATTLLHEAFLDLSKGEARFPSRGMFFSYAAHAMRSLIVDYIRERRAMKRGGEFHLTTLNADIDGPVPELDVTMKLDEALKELATVDAPLAELVDLKFFCGFTFEQIAGFRGVSDRTIQREWAKARLLLFDMLRGD
jgi:RNA polymerase sigma factor (TIGR02999 family)